MQWLGAVSFVCVCLYMNELPLNYVLQYAKFLLQLCSYSDCGIDIVYVVL